MGDDLAAELHQQPIGRLVGRLVEPGQKVFVGGRLVCGPQQGVNQLVIARVAGDQPNGIGPHCAGGTRHIDRRRSREVCSLPASEMAFP